MLQRLNNKENNCKTFNIKACTNQRITRNVFIIPTKYCMFSIYNIRYIQAEELSIYVYMSYEILLPRQNSFSNNISYRLLQNGKVRCTLFYMKHKQAPSCFAWRAFWVNRRGLTLLWAFVLQHKITKEIFSIENKTYKQFVVDFQVVLEAIFIDLSNLYIYSISMNSPRCFKTVSYM